MVNAGRSERHILAPDLAGAVTQAGVDPALEGRAAHRCNALKLRC
jgi:hypothetical protein